MREQELRIALVCFGGVSLAVYMHGISKEILKLVRASCALHAIADRQARMSAQFFDRFDPLRGNRRAPEIHRFGVELRVMRSMPANRRRVLARRRKTASPRCLLNRSPLTTPEISPPTGATSSTAMPLPSIAWSTSWPPKLILPRPPVTSTSRWPA